MGNAVTLTMQIGSTVSRASLRSVRATAGADCDAIFRSNVIQVTYDDTSLTYCKRISGDR